MDSAPAQEVACLTKNSREDVRIALTEFQGLKLVDLRIYAFLSGENGTKYPTKKGLSLRVERLPALIKALRKAEAEAQRQGLLGPKAAAE